MVLPLSIQKKYKIKVDFCVNDLPFFTTFTYLFNSKKNKMASRTIPPFYILKMLNNTPYFKLQDRPRKGIYNSELDVVVLYYRN